ncbi:hypothetical protein C9890_0704 [Perkinsus sp. BL_2016]|nr:hypothetical protein C9890_0704 [Perkinsus sp. BL_2016]
MATRGYHGVFPAGILQINFAHTNNTFGNSKFLVEFDFAIVIVNVRQKHPRNEPARSESSLRQHQANLD